MIYSFVPLNKATLVQRRHPKEVQPPGLVAFDGMLSSRSDATPTLRPDFSHYNYGIYNYGDTVKYGPEEEKDWLNHISGQFGSDALMFFTRHVAGISSDPTEGVTPTMTVKNDTKTQADWGTVTGVQGSRTLTFATGNCLNGADAIWPGCMISLTDSGEVYLIEKVVSATVVQTSFPLATAVTNSDFVCTRSHCAFRGDYAVHAEPYWAGLVYHGPTNLDEGWKAQYVHGPLTSLATETTKQGWEWTTTAAIGSAETQMFGKVYADNGTIFLGTGGPDQPNILYCADDPGNIRNWSALSKSSRSINSNATEQFLYDATLKFILLWNSDDMDGVPVYINAPQISISTNGIAWTNWLIDNWPGAYYEATAMATDGSRIVVWMRNYDSYDNVGSVVYSDDGGDTWTFVEDAMQEFTKEVRWVSATHDGTNFIVVGNNYADDRIEVWYSATGIGAYSYATIAQTGEEERATDIIADTSIPIYVIATDTAEIGFSSPDLNTWTQRDMGDRRYFHLVKVANGDLRALGTGGSLSASTNGTTWGIVNGSSYKKFPETNANLAYLYGVGKYGGKRFYLGAGQEQNAEEAANYQPYIFGWNDSDVVDWTYGSFAPVDDDLRANAFAILNAYCVLMSTREWDAGSWTFHPRRVRWCAPGDLSDWDEAADTGAGVADLEGSGIIKDARSVNNRIVTFETNCVGALIPRGFAEDPWQYEQIGDGIKNLSNPVVVEDVCYFIAQDGLLWQTNAINCSDAGSSFDFTAFDDFNETKPIWMSYSTKTNSLYVYQYNEDATNPKMYSINLNDGTVSSIELPIITSNSLMPRSVCCVSGGNSDEVIVGYEDDGVTTTILTQGYLDFGEAITGKDSMTNVSAHDEYWYATLETGEIYLVPEGQKTSIKHIILRTYCDGTADTNPHILVDVKSIEDSAWHNAGDTFGDMEITNLSLLGDGTAHSHRIGQSTIEVDGSRTTFICPAPPTRVYLKNGSTYTLQVEGTDYNLSGNNIVFVAAPASNNDVYAYWDNFPEIKVEADDFVESSEGLHRITSIRVCGQADQSFYTTTLNLDHYLSTGSETGAAHCPAVQMPNGQGEVVIGLNKLVEGCRLRIRIVPESGGDATVAKITSLAIGHEPCGKKVVEATGS
jgi:hypothetical protein